jgi:hypothetical protein
VPIAAGEREEVTLKIGGSMFMRGNAHIGDYSFSAPKQPTPAELETQGALWRVARLTTTYHDISGRKYASIFDYVYNRGWYKVDIIRDIDHDLDDLDGYVPKHKAIADQARDSNDQPLDVEVVKQIAYLQARQPGAALYDRDRPN